MSGLPPTQSTLSLARETISLGEKSGDRSFKLLGLLLMGATAIGTLFHTTRMLLKDLRADRHQTKTTPRPVEDDHENPDFSVKRTRHHPDPEHDDKTDLTWGQKAERSGRPPCGGSHATAAKLELVHDRQR